MSVRSLSQLGLTLTIILTGACGAEAPISDQEDVDSVADGDDDNDGDDDTTADDDSAGDDDTAGDDDSDDDDVVRPTPRVDAGVSPRPSEAGTPKLDAASGAVDAGRDSGAPRPDATSSADAGEGKSDAGSTGSNNGAKGECCEDGDCLCRGDAPRELTSARGPYKTAEFRIAAGTVHYPTDAEPPFAAVAVCGGFLNTGPEMASWGPFYASHGIVTVITSTGAADIPDIRASKLLAAIEQLKAENTKSGGPLANKLSGRYGTSGYSMGGGGTTIASTKEATLRTSVGLAPWGGASSGVKVATLLLCGTSDGTAPCSMSQSVYRGIADPTPKMMLSISGVTHFNWFGPTDAGRGTSGAYALAFQKVYLEGDERWKPLLLGKPSNATQMTNIE